MVIDKMDSLLKKYDNIFEMTDHGKVCNFFHTIYRCSFLFLAIMQHYKA